MPKKQQQSAKAAKNRTVKMNAAIKAPLKKLELYTQLAAATELTRKDIHRVFDALSSLIGCHFKKGAAGEFTLPGVMKCVIKRKPATKAREGVNPFTGETMTFKAKPARNVVRLRPLKNLKEMVQ